MKKFIFFLVVISVANGFAQSITRTEVSGKIIVEDRS